MYSNSPSNVPATVQVPDGIAQAILPFEASDIVAVIVFVSVVFPTSRILNFTEPPVKSMASQVSEFSVSNVYPLAAVLLSFRVNSREGNVSPTTNFIVSEYAIVNFTFLML